MFMKPSRSLRAAIGASVLGLLGVGSAGHADLLYFKKDGDAQLPARIEGNRVIISMPDGQLDLAKDSVRKLVPGFWPETDWPERLRLARARDFDAQFAAAWWAVENGLTKDAA